LSADPVHRTGAKFRGFRAWTLDGYRLRSANPAGGHWTAGVNHAECRRTAYDPIPLPPTIWGMPGFGSRSSSSAHVAPDPDCRCGLYAWYEPRGLAGFGVGGDELVYGVVLAWGRVEAHLEGLRAEHAEPVVLAYSESQSYRHVRRVQAIGSELGLQVVELGELEEAASGYGQPVPMELRPKRIPGLDIDARWAFPLAAGGLLVATVSVLEGLKKAQRRAAAATSAGAEQGDGRRPSGG
jgi:hypothetical protein